MKEPMSKNVTDDTRLSIDFKIKNEIEECIQKYIPLLINENDFTAIKCFQEKIKTLQNILWFLNNAYRDECHLE